MTLNLTRRAALKSTGAILCLSSLPTLAVAKVDDMQSAINDLFGDRPITEDRVNLKVPPIAENGYSVSVDVDVNSPMTSDDYVKRIILLSDRNPIPVIASYTLSPRSGLAKVSGRVRLAGTQSLYAIAEMNDGSLYSGSTKTVVTVAACVIL